MIGKILLKNYRKLMSEDTPMGDRKGRLRKIGHHFFLKRNLSFQLYGTNI